MSEESWSKDAIFDTNMLRQELDQRMKMQRPAEIEARIVPTPGQVPVQDDLQAVLADPQLAGQLFAPPDAIPEPDLRSPDAELAAQMGLALYVLHGLHGQDRPGQEHLPRRDDEREQPEPRPASP